VSAKRKDVELVSPNAPVRVSSLLDVRVEIATVGAGTHQAAVDVVRNVEVLIDGMVEKLYFQDPKCGLVTN